MSKTKPVKDLSVEGKKENKPFEPLTLKTIPREQVKSSNYKPANPSAYTYPSEIPLKFKTLVLDPPWDIQQKGNARGAAGKYDLMSLEQIKALPINELLEDNAHVYCWITNGVIPYVNELAEAWGLTYRSIFHWVKGRLGLGMYYRNASESFVFFTKGKAPMLVNNQQNWGFFPLGAHSEKPDEFYSIIQRCSPGPYLELFARKKFPGMYTWGYEVDSDIVIREWPVPSYTENAKLWVDKYNAAHGRKEANNGGV